MLNRRILRIKVLQGLYAYGSYCDANFDLALDYIADKFAPDMSSMEPVDKSELSRDRALSQQLFRDHYENNTIETLKNSDKVVEKIASEAFEYFIKQNEEDYQRIRKTLPIDIEKLYDYYLKLLQLLVLLSQQVQKDIRETEHILIVNGKETKVKNLVANHLIQLIQDDIEFQNQIIRRGISWNNDIGTVYSWYRELIKKDEEYITYCNLEQTNFETDKKILYHLIRSSLFKSDLFNSYMESVDLNWSEDKGVLKSMVSKTIKNIEESDQTLKLAVLSRNWEDDKAFFKDLLKYSIENDKELAEIISGKSKNWDISRMAKVDKIILKMAMSELINFPSIPIKVTINEYIELSKNFSTPKSKKFINGMLDVISTELQEKGIIRKSGRGLIDNK